MFRKRIPIVILLLSIVFCPILKAQKPSDVIDDKNINYGLIHSLFLEKLNKLRTGMGLNSLKEDTLLNRPANDQAEYMNKTGIVGHQQKTKNKTWPTDRVMYYHGTNDRVGENCIQVNLHVQYKNKQGDNVTVNTYEEAAEALFDGWKHSPPHYKNMITPYYDVEGLGFSYDEKTNKFYSTEVFGTPAFRVPKGFKIKEDAWGVSGGSPDGGGFFSKSLSGSLLIMNDSIFLYYDDLREFVKYVRGANDGLAIDIVAREQFNCDHNNNLHGNPVFDGWMLEPRYANELIRGNRYGLKASELFTFVAKIPKEVLNKNVQFNTILIKNKKLNGYSYPISLEAANIPMMQLVTYWDTTNGRITADTFNIKMNHYIEFKRGISTLSKKEQDRLLNRISQYKKYITEVEIKTFSSVEGNVDINTRLQKERAENIKSELAKMTNKDVQWSLDSKENWDAFYRQIDGTKYEYLKNYDHKTIKLMLYSSALCDSLDPFLRQERTAIVTFHLNGKYTEDLAEDGISRIALQSAIGKEDVLKAWYIQSKMIVLYTQKKVKLEDVIDNDVPVEERFLPLLANKLAAKAIDPWNVLDPKFKQFAKQVFALGKNSAPIKLSYCVCAINYLSVCNDTLIKNDKLETYLGDCANDSKLAPSMGRYYLDYYIAAAHYHWLKRQYSKLDTDIEGIQKYYPKLVLADTDYVKLGRLFNLYGRTNLTYYMLYPLVKNGTTNEDLLFLFVTTAVFYKDEMGQDEYTGYLIQARKMNQARFCNWISAQNWQLLRVDFIKKLFCEECNM